MQFGLDRPGTDMCNLDLGVSKLLTQAQDERIDRGFGCTVGRHWERWDQGDLRTGEDQAGRFVARKKMREHGVHEGDVGHEVDGDFAVEGL